jgi:DNA-binding NarL/FixJ family response regulator
VRRGVRDLLSAARDLIVVGEASAAGPAAKQILALDVDVMLLDLHLRDGSGIAVCRRVRSAEPGVRGLLLTAAGDDEAALAAVLAGASGFATKFARSADLLGAIRSLGSTNASLLDPATATRVKSEYLARLDDLRPRLSDDERDLLASVADGRTDAEIAARLGLDEESLHDTIAALIERSTRPG